MKGFKGQFTRIKGVSEKRRLPRLGKIRLGIKVRNKGGMTKNCEHPKEQVCMYCSHPKETPYFVCPPEVEAHYGPQPKELNILLPVNDPEIIFPQKYTWYGASRGPKCIGNGERAMRVNEQGEFESWECPCEHLLEIKDCQRRAHLMFLLLPSPPFNLGGVYQIDIGSYHSIVDINSGLDLIESMVGRFAMVPCKLRREPRETHGSGRKEIHYTLTLRLDATVELLNELRENTRRVLMGPQYVLPAPEDTNPKMDENGVVVDVIDEEADSEEPVLDQEPESDESGEPMIDGEPESESQETRSPPQKEPKVDPARPLTKQEQEIQARLMNCTDMQGLTKIFNNLTKGQRQKFLGLFNNIKKSLKQNSEIPPGEEDIPF